MKMKKIAALSLAAVMAMSLCACGNQSSGRKTSISVGLWPNETQKETLEMQNKNKDNFMAANPDIEIIPNTYQYDTKTFMMKASAKQLPTMYRTFFTEISQIVNQGYAANITDQVKAHGFDTTMNETIKKLVTDDKGDYYALPVSAYTQGLYINKALFKEAGLVNADGTIKVPDTWQELGEYAKIIKEKTGKAGYVIPTINNCGGWHFLNIAWSYGVEFEKQREDGTWEATFDTQGARDALQFVKDLKWKYNAILDDNAIGQDDMYKYFGSSQVAMMIQSPIYSGYQWGLDDSNLYVTKIPAGPNGRYAQMGGDVWMFAPEATADQIDAGMRWLSYIGQTSDFTDEQAELYKKDTETYINESHGICVERDGFDVWSNSDKSKKTYEIRKEFQNVDYNDYKTYFEADDVTVNLEPAACAQQLYAVLDKCIQEVFTNENADVDTLIKDACHDFQVNHLDKM